MTDPGAIRLRVHDDGRWAVQRPDGDWDGPHGQTFYGNLVYEPGWHEAVALSPCDEDAKRLADAMREAPNWQPAAPDADRDFARAVLDRLAAGTEGER